MNRLPYVANLACWSVLICLTSCSRKERPLLELLSPDDTGVAFANTLYEDDNLNIITFEYFYNGAGVGLGDINNDGLTDVFFTANMVSNKLYLNKGNFVFEDITERAGLSSTGKWATGASLVDINQDGWLDLYVCYAGPFADAGRRANELYINNKDNTFTEQAKQYGLDDTGHTVQAAFFDYDRDNDLDVYLLTNITGEPGPNVIRPKRTQSEMPNTDRLYRNNGNGTFTNVSKEAGITIEGYGLGVSIADLNQDTWPDIYVSNDYLSNDLLYINNRNGTFTDHTKDYLSHTSYSAMGNDVADFNNDAWPDIVAVDMLPPDNTRQKLMFGATGYDRYRSELQYGYTPQFMRNTLQLNLGTAADTSLLFSEIGQLAGIHATDWSWSALFADLDNDGWKDLVVTNGYPRDITNRDFASFKAHEFMQRGYNASVKHKLMDALQSLEGAYLPNFVFQNQGNLFFKDQSATWGFTQASYSTGAAYGDLDNDGDLDLVINNTNAPAFIYKNNTDKLHHFLKIRFEGPEQNRAGLGAKVWAYTTQGMQYFEHYPYRGFQSTVEEGIHIGLGEVAAIDSVVVQWPDGKRQAVYHPPIDQTLLSTYNAASDRTQPKLQKRAPTLLFEMETTHPVSFRHRETHFADFKIQPLIPHKYSQNGPALAVGDVNGDGLEDVFAGGAYKQPGEFFIQNKDGSFLRGALTDNPKFEEDMGALLFDADGDRDLDLYVVSGGNEFEQGSAYYEDRLYVNDGKGNFNRKKDALPRSAASGSCVVAGDYDRDGDLDLFIGGRLTPHRYPETGESLLLRNDGGRFTDVTDDVAPGLRRAGMVTAALWTDYNNDQQPDLMIAGEWMPIVFFRNSNGELTREANDKSVPASEGWWNSIQGADFDCDGDTDYVLGNLGLNSRYKTSIKEPVTVSVADLNNDGSPDPILAHYIQGVNRPAHPRDDLLQQVTSLRKRFSSYAAYSEASMTTLLGEAKPVTYVSRTFETSYLENRGKDGWRLTPLPTEAQFAPVYGILAGDYTGDDHADLVLVGNSCAPDVLTGRYDASTSLLLKGDGAGTFKPVNHRESGLLVKGDMKSLVELTTASGEVIVVAARNDDLAETCKSKVRPLRVIDTRQDDFYAILIYRNGKMEKRELYFGSGYLSQSSRKIRISGAVSRITIVNLRGEARTVVPES